jgi:hypothetical protein
MRRASVLSEFSRRRATKSLTKSLKNGKIIKQGNESISG